jgi:hypothetical protein
MKVLVLPPEKTLKPLARLRLLAADMAVNGSDRPEIVAALNANATPEDLHEGFAYWARHLARDVVAAAHKAGGASPRAESHNGQTSFGWGAALVVEGLAEIDRYIHRYAGIIRKVDLGRRMAGASAEDLEALAS